MPPLWGRMSKRVTKCKVLRWIVFSSGSRSWMAAGRLIYEDIRRQGALLPSSSTSPTIPLPQRSQQPGVIQGRPNALRRCKMLRIRGGKALVGDAD